MLGKTYYAWNNHGAILNAPLLLKLCSYSLYLHGNRFAALGSRQIILSNGTVRQFRFPICCQIRSWRVILSLLSSSISFRFSSPGNSSHKTWFKQITTNPDASIGTPLYLFSLTVFLTHKVHCTLFCLVLSRGRYNFQSKRFCVSFHRFEPRVRSASEPIYSSSAFYWLFWLFFLYLYLVLETDSLNICAVPVSYFSLNYLCWFWEILLKFVRMVIFWVYLEFHEIILPHLVSLCVVDSACGVSYIFNVSEHRNGLIHKKERGRDEVDSVVSICWNIWGSSGMTAKKVNSHAVCKYLVELDPLNLKWSLCISRQHLKEEVDLM